MFSEHNKIPAFLAIVICGDLSSSTEIRLHGLSAGKHSYLGLRWCFLPVWIMLCSFCVHFLA